MRVLFNNIIAKIAIAIAILATAAGATAQTYTITLVNGTVHTYEASALDSIQFVGGTFGSTTGVGVKVYPSANSGHSVEFLYSQNSSLVISGGAITVDTPTISPAGGSYTVAQSVTVATTTAGATVYYTTDGTTPSASNYTGRGSTTVTFTLNSSAVVKAIAIYNGTSSATASATFTIITDDDNNANANWHATTWTSNNLASGSGTPSSYGFWRLEVPHISSESNTSWLQKSTSSYGVTYAIEWSNTLIANRWTCYQFHAGNRNGSTTGSDTFKEDTELPSATRSKQTHYSSSGYSRGHLCPSADRKMSSEQNAQTYRFGNMQPQWQAHNGGQWNNLEADVRTWAGKCDTLFIVKAATIDNITLSGTTESGVYSTTYNGTTYSDLKCNGTLPVPKYFYMALLAYTKSSQDSGDGNYYGTFRALGIWTKHYNSGTKGADSSTHDWPVINEESAEYITIDELEARTGIDFFCNLPDDIEVVVEAADSKSWWSSGASLNR